MSYGLVTVCYQLHQHSSSYLQALRRANHACIAYGAEQVRKYPDRFGLLCALPTEDAAACLSEISRAQTELGADGYAATTERKGVSLSDPSLDPVWARLDSVQAIVFAHPNAYAPPRHGRPTALIEVAFDTCRVAVDMLYCGVFQRFPNIKFVFAHCGGALPAMSGRLELLGAEPWVPNPRSITSVEIIEQLRRLYVDTAATTSTGLEPALRMVGSQHVVYGSDCGVPCSTKKTMEENRKAVSEIEHKLGLEVGYFGSNAWNLFPSAAQRVARTKFQSIKPST